MLTYDTLPECVKRNLHNNIIMSVAFVKRTNGEMRHMCFKKKINYPGRGGNPENQGTVNANYNLLTIADLNKYITNLHLFNGNKEWSAKECYRKISLDNVLGFLCGRHFYDMRDENDILNRFGEESYNQLTKGMIGTIAREQEVLAMEENPQHEPINEIRVIKFKSVINEDKIKQLVGRFLREQIFINEKRLGKNFDAWADIESNGEHTKGLKKDKVDKEKVGNKNGEHQHIKNHKQGISGVDIDEENDD